MKALIAPAPKLYITALVKDPRTGKVTYKHRQPGHSYIKNLIDLLYVHFTGTPSPTYNIQQISGANQGIGISSNTFALHVLSGPNNSGIVVGNGTAPVTIDDYALAAIIGDGAAAGQLNYLGHTVLAPLTVGTKRRTIISRTYLNTSGDTVTVKECGLYVHCSYGFIQVCMIRDLVTPNVAVPNLQTLTLTYELSVTV